MLEQHSYIYNALLRSPMLLKGEGLLPTYLSGTTTLQVNRGIYFWKHRLLACVLPVLQKNGSRLCGMPVDSSRTASYARTWTPEEAQRENFLLQDAQTWTYSLLEPSPGANHWTTFTLKSIGFSSTCLQGPMAFDVYVSHKESLVSF